MVAIEQEEAGCKSGTPHAKPIVAAHERRGGTTARRVARGAPFPGMGIVAGAR